MNNIDEQLFKILRTNPDQLSFIFLHYEITSSFLAQYTSNDYLQKLLGKYYARKVNKKVKSIKDLNKFIKETMDA